MAHFHRITWISVSIRQSKQMWFDFVRFEQAWLKFYDFLTNSGPIYIFFASKLSKEHPFVCRKWISNVNFIEKKYLYHQSQYSKTWGSKCLALIAQIVKAFKSPSHRDIFCLKNFDAFAGTPVRVSKMSAVARAKLTFQMLTLLQQIVYIYMSHYSVTDLVCIHTYI